MILQDEFTKEGEGEGYKCDENLYGILPTLAPAVSTGTAFAVTVRCRSRYVWRLCMAKGFMSL